LVKSLILIYIYIYIFYNLLVSVDALNSADVLILDDDVKIWQWNGTKCNKNKRGKALDMTTRLRDERMNRVKAEVIIVQEGKEQDEFWKVLGGKPSGPLPCDKDADDDAFEAAALKEDRVCKLLLLLLLYECFASINDILVYT